MSAIFEKNEILEGHEADGIQELDNDLPLWWFVGFVFTVVFGLGYVVNYMLSEGPSSKAEYDREVAAWKKPGEMDAAAMANLPPIEPRTDFKALDTGRQIFEGQRNTCYTCHRVDLGGQVGPNLTDEYWIHGCDMRTIMKNISTGFPLKGMLPYGNGNKLTDEELLDVASYIISKKGSNPANPKPNDPARELKCSPDDAKDAAEAKKDDHDQKEVKEHQEEKGKEKIGEPEHRKAAKGEKKK